MGSFTHTSPWCSLKACKLLFLTGLAAFKARFSSDVSKCLRLAILGVVLAIGILIFSRLIKKIDLCSFVVYPCKVSEKFGLCKRFCVFCLSYI